MAFGLSIFDLAPGLRLMGDSLAYAYKFTKRGGEADGTKGLEVGLTDDPMIKLLEASVSGYEQVADSDAVYSQLVAGGLTELVPGLAVGIDSLSTIDTDAALIRLGIAGAQPQLKFHRANVQEVTKVGDSGYVWQLPTATFDALKTAAESYQSDLQAKVDAMIAARISADGVLQAAIDSQATSDATARAAIQADVDQNEADADAALAAEVVRVDDLIASGMWLFPDQAAFPAAADNHGRVVHSHADGSIFYSHGGMWHKVENEAEAEAARLALSNRLDTLEVDPTTATAVAAGDAATLSSANTYTDGAVAGEAATRTSADDALSSRLDVLEADPTTQTLLDAESTARAAAIALVQGDVDQNEADADAADSALSGRLDVLEADPTTATAVAAVQGDVDQNEADSDAADAALSGRLDVLEADPTTAAAVAAVQADVDQNEADSDAAESALSARLDVLEADPTTATAVAAVQADVDQNEADADAALALKAPLADPDFTGVLEVDTSARLEFDSNLTKLHNVLRSTSIQIGNNIQLYPAAADGRVEIEGGLYLRPSDIGNYANDTDAAAGGVVVGGVYHHNGTLRIRLS